MPATAEPIALAGGEIHYRDLDLAAGDFLQVMVAQLGADVFLELADAGGEVLVRVDSPNEASGSEQLVARAPAGGRHRLRVGAGVPGASGRYRFEVRALRPATPADLRVVEADRACREGQELLGEGEPAQAAVRFKNALSLLDGLGLARQEADAWYGLYTAYEALGRQELAAVAGERAAGLYRREPEPLLLAVALRSSGWMRLRLGQPERALGSLTEAAAIAAELGHPVEESLALAHLGVAHHAMGEVQRAVTLLEQALARQQGTGDEAAEAAIRSDLATALLALHRPGEALEHSTRALAVHRRLEDAGSVALALRGIARASAQLGELDRAQRGIDEALEVVRRAGDPAALRVVLASLGTIRRSQGDYPGARQALEEALALAREGMAREHEAVLLVELGYLRRLEGEPEDGLRLEDQAMELFAAAANLKGQASARVRGAEALGDLGRLAEAWQRLAPALDIIDGLRDATERRDFRSTYFAFRQDYYEIAIDLLMRLHEGDPAGRHLETAFWLNERRLARELLEARQTAEARGAAAVPPALRAMEEELERRLGEAAGAPGERGEQVVGELLGELERLRAEVRKLALPALPPRSDELTAVRQAQASLIDQDSVVLAFSLGERRSYRWTLTGETVEARALPGRATIEPLARRFAEAARLRGTQAEATRRRLGLRLAQLLIGPEGSALARPRLVLIADGALQLVPWAALPDPEGSGAYLVEGHEIVVLPSLGTLATLRHRTRPARKPPTLAAFADPVFRADDPRVAGAGGASGLPAAEVGVGEAASGERTAVVAAEVERSAGRLGVDPLERLPYSTTEVDRILALAPGGPHLRATDFEASRQKVLAADWSRYDLVHFATHGLLHPEHPELSGLMLSMFDAAGRSQDGFLRAVEISRLHLPAELVVLSACETGIGKDLRGEGMMSLTRSFLEAGAAAVVASLWRVGDRSTAELMARLYDGHLRLGLPPAAALRRAQLALLAESDTALPYHWAGFQFQGDWQGPR